MKSSFKNMTIVMFCITLICSAAVGGVYLLTKERIEQAATIKFQKALSIVLPAFDAVSEESVDVNGEMITINTATLEGRTVGYAVSSNAGGFGGTIDMVVGFDAEGKVVGVNVLKHSETPGLGSLIANEGNILVNQFVGNNPAEMTLKVRKDGGSIDALTGATITSRAYINGVEKAFNAYLRKTTGTTAEGYTGATTVNATDKAEKGEENE
jgi:electron transport complex protein RnfG